MPAETIEAAAVLQAVNTYAEYQRREGIPVLRGFAVDDLYSLELAQWARREGRGAFVNLDGAGGTTDAYVCEVPPGGALAPQRQLYEEMIYVLDGSGSTQVWYEEGQKVSFEWRAGSLFAVPLNTWHRHFNGRGDRPARYVAVTNAPLIMNLFHNLDFVFNTPYVFDDRFAGQASYFNGEGTKHWVMGGRGYAVKTNFVPDAHALELQTWRSRGAGGKVTLFELADNTMCAHVAEFPVGTYKKAHRHGPGAHVIILDGQGYSLLWPQGEAVRRVAWRPATVVVPPCDWFHQHFNGGARPVRYLAMRWGSQRYDMPATIRGNTGESDVSVKEGGAQIEYQDEDPAIHQLFESELACSRATCRMRGMVPWCTGE
jgi:oxalate decarboxylase/phosphoglucose isomerase-like protein (cupin superfamily)